MSRSYHKVLSKPIHFYLVICNYLDIPSILSCFIMFYHVLSGFIQSCNFKNLTLISPYTIFFVELTPIHMSFICIFRVLTFSTTALTFLGTKYKSIFPYSITLLFTPPFDFQFILKIYKDGPDHFTKRKRFLWGMEQMREYTLVVLKNYD